MLLLATLRHDGESHAVQGARRALRGRCRGACEVGGSSGGQVDFQNAVSGSMWKIVLFVLALSYVVLMVLLRSVVLPLEGRRDEPAVAWARPTVCSSPSSSGAGSTGSSGFQSPGHLDTLTPPLVLAVVFGLSMDYEVFLLSRIRERYRGDRRHAPRGRAGPGVAARARSRARRSSWSRSSPSFVGTGVPSIKQIGLGNAVAIAVDATLVRLVLVPAAMELLGKWNWFMPRSLGRVLPRASFEELPAPAGARG